MCQKCVTVVVVLIPHKIGAFSFCFVGPQPSTSDPWAAARRRCSIGVVLGFVLQRATGRRRPPGVAAVLTLHLDLCYGGRRAAGVGFWKNRHPKCVTVAAIERKTGQKWVTVVVVLNPHKNPAVLFSIKNDFQNFSALPNVCRKNIFRKRPQSQSQAIQNRKH